MARDLSEQLKTHFGSPENKEYKKREKAKSKLIKALGVFEIVKYKHDRADMDDDFMKKPVVESLTKYGKKKERTLESISQEMKKEVAVVLGNEQLLFDAETEFYFIRREGKVGLADPRFKVICEPQFDNIHPLHHNAGSLFVVEKGSKQGLIDVNGNLLVEPLYDCVEDLYHGGVDTGSFMRLIIGDKVGIVGIQKKKDSKLGYDKIFTVEPFAEKIEQESFGYIFGKQGGKTFAFKADEPEKTFIVADADGYWHMDHEKKIIICFLDGQWQLKKYGERRGDIVETQELGWDKEVEYFDWRNGPYIKYKKDGKFGINKRGMKEVTKPEYEDITTNGQGGSNLDFIYKKNGKRGLMLVDGKPWIPEEYEAITTIPGSHMRRYYVKKNNMRKLWVSPQFHDDPDYNTETEYEEILSIKNQSEKESVSVSYVIVKRGGSYGIANVWLKELVLPEYDNIRCELVDNIMVKLIAEKDGVSHDISVQNKYNEGYKVVIDEEETLIEEANDDPF